VSSGDCSDSGSSQEDSCSTSSSAQKDSNTRHCDCCYCEVFGHGMVSLLLELVKKKWKFSKFYLEKSGKNVLKQIEFFLKYK